MDIFPILILIKTDSGIKFGQVTSSMFLPVGIPFIVVKTLATGGDEAVLSNVLTALNGTGRDFIGVITKAYLDLLGDRK